MNHPHQPQGNEEPRLLLPTKSDSGVRWTSSTIMEWMEGLANDAEVADGQGPLMLGGIALSSPSPSWSVEQPQPGVSGQRVQPDESLLPPQNFDVSFIQQRDPLATMAVGEMHRLASALETLHNVDMAAYLAVYTRLSTMFAAILQHSTYDAPPSDGEMRSLLDTLYGSTIDKLQELLTSAACGHGKPMPRKDFGKYMMDWLRDNWTNPYPDEPGLEEMARECGVTPTVVANWLINARTRKWRPAIIKAAEMERPIEMLLEDSINLFDGHPVRDIADYQTGHDNKRRKMEEV